jgi:2-aminobenzoate-CoA ligase
MTYPNKLNCAYEIFKQNELSDKVAIYFKDGAWTYHDLTKKINKISHFLSHSLMVKPGDRILLNGFSSPMLAACWFAIIKIGAICVATSSSLKERELASIISQSGTTLAIVDAAIPNEVEKAQISAPALEKIIFFNSIQAETLETRIADLPESFAAHSSNKNDIALIAFTSGSTGKPKATLHSHQDVMYICDCFPKDILETSANEIFAGTPPLAFTFGLGGALLFPLRYGASAVLLDRLSPENLLKAISDFKVTTCFSSPTGYRLMLEHIERYDIHSLQKCISAGEHLPKKTFEAWLKKTNIKIIDGIGSTEMLHIFISASPNQIIPGATGTPIPGYEAKIIDEHGAELKNGEIGLLAVRGPTGCKYLEPEIEKKYRIDGWNLTGDLFSKSDDGYYWYHSRADDMIISSGYNISGTEIEEVLLEHPDVLESAVVGIPDELRGQLIKAYVKLKPTAQFNQNDQEKTSLQSFVKTKLAIYKCPHLITFIDEIPRNSTGKIQRFALKN